MKKSVTILLLLRRLDCNDGVASYCETLIEGLRAQGDRVVIVSGPVTQLYGSASRFQAISEGAVDWIVLPRLNSKWPGIKAVRAILAAISSHEVNVISPQGLSLLPLTRLLSLVSGRKVIANYHPSMGGSTAGAVATVYSSRAKLGYRALIAFCRPDRLIAISKEASAFFQLDCGVDPRRIVLINNGINTKFYRPPTPTERLNALAQFSIPENTLVCELSGRLNFNKGHDIAVDAIRLLRAAKPELNIICLFPGGGDQAEEIKASALRDAADSNSFRFLGFTDIETLRNVYWASDIGLLPSRFEGFGISMIEAMSCGCVAIRTPGGGWQEQIVEGVNGFIIPFNNAQALADCIADLSDPKLRAIMRVNAMNYAAENFSQEQMISKTSALYREVANYAKLGWQGGRGRNNDSDTQGHSS